MTTTPVEHVVVRRRPKTLRTGEESSITPGCPSSQRRLNVQDISKRLSLPADLNVPDSFLAKHIGPGRKPSYPYNYLRTGADRDLWTCIHGAVYVQQCGSTQVHETGVFRSLYRFALACFEVSRYSIPFAFPESPLDGPLTRKLRRTSLSELGFGRSNHDVMLVWIFIESTQGLLCYLVKYQ